MPQCLKMSSGALECEASSACNHWNTKALVFHFMLTQNQSSWYTGTDQGPNSSIVPNDALEVDNTGCLSHLC